MQRSRILTPRPWALALTLIALTAVAGCSSERVADDDDGGGSSSEDSYGIEGELGPGEPLGKADSVGVKGPKVNTNTSATQVWTARNKWEDATTPAAQKAGMAWPENSGLNWDDKFQRWVESMERTAGQDTYYDTFTLTTPWGKTLPAPKLECAELAIFLRVTFAAWYELPFYMTAQDSKGTRVYFGHFGARTKTQRYKNTPNYGNAYKDFSSMSAEDIAADGWPQDAKLRARGLYGGGDDMDWLFEGARAGAYFDEVHLNKRVGHFMRLLLAYFGSMHLASSRNTFNLKPEAIQEGDVLVQRWQKSGIGHTLVVKEIEQLQGAQMEANLVSGSMPRRQPKWEDAVASKANFLKQKAGGLGDNSAGLAYASLGGGLKRFRVTKNVGGYWMNTWMAEDEASWINDSDHEAIAARPAKFDQLLGQVTPEEMRDALVGIIEDARNHLREYPASCSAREKREDAFDELYALMQSEFGTNGADTDAQYRIFEDYVFAKLEYTASKTCCWNSTNSAMFQIVMDYNESLQDTQCTEATVFKCSGGGYQVFQQYAEATGRGHLWKPWSEDESCPQRDVQDDTIVQTTEAAWCDIDQGGGGTDPTPGGCADDGYEDNDSSAEATPMSGGNHSGLMACSEDDDYYQVVVPAGGSLSVTIDFSHDEGDLDLALFEGGSAISSSTSTADNETVTADGGGSYSVRVYGYNSAQAAYALSVSIQ